MTSHLKKGDVHMTGHSELKNDPLIAEYTRQQYIIQSVDKHGYIYAVLLRVNAIETYTVDGVKMTAREYAEYIFKRYKDGEHVGIRYRLIMEESKIKTYELDSNRNAP